MEHRYLVHVVHDWHNPRGCSRRGCPRCSAYGASLLAEAIVDSRPDHFLTITNLHDNFPEIQGFWKNLRRRMERAVEPSEIDPFAWLYVVERTTTTTPRTSMCSSAATSPSRDWWTATLAESGIHVFDVRPAGDHHRPLRLEEHAFRTVGHEDTGPACFDCTEIALADHLAINGGRLVHQSTNFFITRDGEPVTLRRACDVVKARRRRTRPDWVPMFRPLVPIRSRNTQAGVMNRDQSNPIDLSERPVLLTREEAAALLGTTERHVRRLVERGILTAVRLGGKVRIRTEDLDACVSALPSRPASHREAVPWVLHRAAATIPFGPPRRSDHG